MKKYLALLAGVVFLLSFTASAFAIHGEIPAEAQGVVSKSKSKITLGGDLRFRGEARNNTSDFNSDAADHIAFYDGRVRLSVNADVTPATTGYIQLEAADGPTSTAYNWGTTTANGKGSTGLYKEGDVKKGTINVLEAWILHTGSGLLGVSSGIKVGHMPLALGNNLFFDHSLFGDDAIVVFANPSKELHIAALTAKFREGNAALSDDSTGYVGLFAYKGAGYNLSGDLSYVDDQNICLGLALTCHLWNFALRGDTNVSGLGIKADLELQTGSTKGAAALDFRGYAFLAGLSYKLDTVNLSLDYAYGSGDDNPKDGKVSTFMTSLSNAQHTTFVYDYRTVSAAGSMDSGLANTRYAKLGASTQMAKDITGDFNIYLLSAAKAVYGALIDAGLAKTTSSKSIGTEVDAKVNYAIDRNLNYYVEGGYLFAGDYWKTALGANKSDGAYAIRHGIQLSF